MTTTSFVQEMVLLKPGTSFAKWTSSNNYHGIKKQCHINTAHILKGAIEFFSIKWLIAQSNFLPSFLDFWTILGYKRITLYCHCSSQCSLSLCPITSESGRSWYLLPNIDNENSEMGQVSEEKRSQSLYSKNVDCTKRSSEFVCLITEYISLLHNQRFLQGKRR